MIAPEVQHSSYIALCKICAFFINRFPYVSAISLMLSTSEKVRTVRTKTLDMHMVYAHLGMFFLAGTAMAFDILKLARFFAFVTIGQFAFRCYEEYSAGQYKDSVMAKILMRNIAIMGCYCMVAGGLVDFQKGAPRNLKLITFGKQVLGAYSFFNAVMIWNSYVEFRAYSTHLPGGWITTYGIMVMYIICGILIYANYESEYFSKLLGWVLLVDTVFVDMDTKFWWNATQITYWTQMTMASMNLCTVAALILIRNGM